jgi:hypothetical protein
MARLLEEVEWFARQRIEFVFCCDANFGMLPRDLDLARHLAATKAKHGYPQALSVQNTKNATDRAYQVQKLLSDVGLNKGVSISLQTVDNRALKAIKRQNISSASFEELQRRFTRDGVETYSDMILGLPEETYDSFADGISRVIETGQHNRIQFNNLSILPNAEMGDPEYQKAYGMETVRSKIINIHGSLLTSEDDVQEYQDLVIATRTMPRSDWRRTRAFCWMAALLHFDKVFQIPLIVAHELTGVRFRELLEAFSDGDVSVFPTLAYIQEFFAASAADIQQGGEEYCRSERWLNIYWPADELVFIHLCTEGRLPAFYREARECLSRFLEKRGAALPEGVLEEAVLLNHRLVKQPFQEDDLQLELRHNLWEFYRGACAGSRVGLERRPCVYRIDRTSRRFHSWEEWCQQVVWYGNKKGAYLYANQAVEPQYEGHF